MRWNRPDERKGLYDESGFVRLPIGGHQSRQDQSLVGLDPALDQLPEAVGLGVDIGCPQVFEGQGQFRVVQLGP